MRSIGAILAVTALLEAEAHLQQAISLRSEVEAAHLNLGAVVFKKGEVEASRREFSEALRLNPLLTTAYFNLGMLEFADGHFDEAEQLFKQALARDPTHQTASVQLGNLDVKHSKFTAALHVLGSALMLKPRDARTNLVTISLTPVRSELDCTRYISARRATMRRSGLTRLSTRERPSMNIRRLTAIQHSRLQSALR